MENNHIPVLVSEIMEWFAPQSDNCLLDATLGLGGHSQAFLEASGPHGVIIGLEADAQALERARERLKKYGERAITIHTNFWQIKDSVTGGGILSQEIPSITHVLFDLGIGSHQLADAERGFSFQSAGPLRMKFGAQDSLPPSDYEPLNMLEHRLGRPPEAYELVTQLRLPELVHILRAYGEERFAVRIAKALQMNIRPGMTAAEVGEIIARSVPVLGRERLHPATRSFQALRIAVNRELEALRAALPQALEVAAVGAVVAVISFHSLEDRIVKQWMREQAKGCICPPGQPICTCGHKPTAEVLTKRPVTASEAEIERNPRSRSAKLRVLKKLPP